MKNLLLFLILIAFSVQLNGQLNQTISGLIVDKITQQTLPGASVVLKGSDPVIGTSTDGNGRFRLSNVPVGRQSLIISFLGYETVPVNNLIVTSGKEVNLTLELVEKAETLHSIEVSASRDKDRAINKMASVSARAFTVEETEKYAGSRGDVARMAMNYAGVSGANDQRNDIVIRGNSPVGLLWKLEGIDIGNPSHFAQQGTTGGPVGMLNNNTLRNSDFFTGAFPAEYGNALSGVFDLKMKSGNKEKYEFLGQIGFNGFELGAEGPIAKKNLSSFLINYRYSTLGLMSDMGADIGTGGGVPYYQDLNYNIEIPVGKGRLNLVGLAGTSNIAIKGEDAGEDNIYSAALQDLYNGSDLMFNAIIYGQSIGKKTFMRHSVSHLYENGWTNIDTLDLQFDPSRYFEENSVSQRFSYQFSLNHKVNSTISTKAGLTTDLLGFDLNSSVWDEDENEMRTIFQSKKDLSEGTLLVRAYNQWLIKLNDRYKITPGLHAIHFQQTGEFVLEPRVGMEYTLNRRSNLTAGYGHHSRIQALSAYFIKTRLPNQQFAYTNEDMEMTKAHHAVLGYNLKISEHARFKAEVYYQHLYNVPVEQNPSSFTILNSGSSYGVNSTDSLINTGAGRNYGIEVTLERFYNKGYYFLITGSLFESRYTGSDDVERNTAFNGNYVLNALVGKEYEFNNQSALFFDLKGTYAGGSPYTPIDVAASMADNSSMFNSAYEDDKAFSLKFTDYLKVDVKAGYRMNGKHTTQEWMIYIENVTNHDNVLMQYWDSGTQAVKTVYQLGLFPMMQYRIYF
jgi:hypothetical protein